MRYGGWYQIAFERDLQADVSSVPVGDRRLLIVRSGGEINVYDAVCPHRGADLGVGGKLLDPRVLTCPYHGHRIALGGEGGGPYCVAKYPSLVRSGLIFALVGDFEVGKLPDMLDYLERTHKIFAGFTKTIKVPPEMVIENAFDWAHFPPVHDVLKVEYGDLPWKTGSSPLPPSCAWAPRCGKGPGTVRIMMMVRRSSRCHCLRAPIVRT